MSASVVLIVFAVIITFICVMLYNRLVRLRNAFENAFAQIDVQLQRRYELIPNVVETASAYMKHESDTLTAVTEARNMASDQCSKASSDPGNGTLLEALSAAEHNLAGVMGRLNVVMESYPDLQASSTMRELHEELSSTENRVAFSRQAFNDAVMRYNTAREQFPAILVANALSFKVADLFVAEDDSIKQAIKISFNQQSRAA